MGFRGHETSWEESNYRLGVELEIVPTIVTKCKSCMAQSWKEYNPLYELGDNVNDCDKVSLSHGTVTERLGGMIPSG